jgi:hypothetical protein
VKFCIRVWYSFVQNRFSYTRKQLFVEHGKLDHIESAPGKGPETLGFTHPNVEVMCLPTNIVSVLERMGQDVIKKLKTP